MRIFKTKVFARDSINAGITDTELVNAAAEVDRGEYEADLGGGVFKKRLARSGGGKSGGYRVILFFRKDERLFFGRIFAKSNLEDIEDDELKWFKGVSREYLEYTDDQLNARIKEGWIKEIVP
ncbi:addiction module toxin RelE [Spirochaetia bacterium]|nr:addiction module toxin RelE [Spirochaetia bacterium]